MAYVEFCPECQIPKTLGDGQEWLNDGDIIQRLNSSARMAFGECEFLDPLFRTIEKMIGAPYRTYVDKHGRQDKRSLPGIGHSNRSAEYGGIEATRYGAVH